MKLRLLVWPKTKLRVKVQLTPMGNKIKYRIYGRVFCSRANRELANSRTYAKQDHVWLNVFGTNNAIERFLKANRVVNKVININALGYDPCDSIR